MDITLDSLHRASRHVSDTLGKAARHVQENPVGYARLYAISLVLFILIYQLLMPIVKGDTDMWYHLNGGRYFWNTGEVPITPFFSFLHPDREWINYFWGFQASIYKVYEWFDYQGLVIIRTLLLVGTLTLVMRILFEHVWEHRNLILFILLTSVFVIFIESRGYQLRPHLVSYLMISLFLFILELRPKWTPILPILTTIWVNVHGVEWVVGGLICGAYFIEYFTNQRFNVDPGQKRSRFFPIWLLLCGVATGLNPHGFDVLLASFSTPELITEFIQEMRPIPPEALHTIVINDLIFSHTDTLAVICILAIIAVIKSIYIRSPRISHLIMFAGGAYLLFRGTRLAWEWALLVLPLIATWSQTFNWNKQTRGNNHTYLLIITVVAIIPFASIGQKLDTSLPYPFDNTELPTEITQFISESGAKGNILVPPSYGGYIQWELYPYILIHSDMEFPPFDEHDFTEIRNAFNTDQGFLSATQKYHVDFIVVQRSHKYFRNIIKSKPEFIPVIFDDLYILYANSASQPAITAKSKIKELNPFNLIDKSIDADTAVHALKSFIESQPNIFRSYHALVRILIDSQRFDEALPYAQTMAKRFPDKPNAHFLLGNILENSEQCQEAIVHYERATNISNKQSKLFINKHIGTCHYLLKDFPTAYDYLNRSLDPFMAIEAIEDLYQLAFTGLVVGQTHQAEIILNSILQQSTEEHEEIRLQAQALLENIDRGEFDIGFTDWMKDPLNLTHE
ncbi:tetratricopeptide repeat protein [Solemya velesiana gill symbiont]|uniref:Uncharacterized protein n=1 Tax=Solemya velesiana gill symbiont TaxID=1918948 RepID=A0A1T2KW13_9GAMM|nr:hypothetical protein [Solemya velesiana gill symbiont]OOZ36930.1 hypothetical protein BOW51_04760 [Solemya velesiana gill symbiont]